MESIKKEHPDWEDKTKEYGKKISKFLKEWAEKIATAENPYDSLNELHFSGLNSDVNEKIKKGEAKIISVKVFGGQDKPEQIHVVFDGENKGHNIDVYFTGKALADFLKFIEKKEN